MKKDTSVESFGASTGQTPPATAAENLGKVEVSPEAIITIAAQAVMEKAYGVVGFASRRLRNGRAEMLRSDQFREGIQLRYDGDQIILDLYVIIEYDTRISEVAHINSTRSTRQPPTESSTRSSGAASTPGSCASSGTHSFALRPR